MRTPGSERGVLPWPQGDGQYKKPTEDTYLPISDIGVKRVKDVKFMFFLFGGMGVRVSISVKINNGAQIYDLLWDNEHNMLNTACIWFSLIFKTCPSIWTENS